MNAWEKWLELHKVNYPCSDYETKDLAEYLKLNRRTLEFWMNGKVRPQEKYFPMIEQYLKERAEKSKNSC